MKQSELDKIRNFFSPVIEEHKEVLKSIIVYGSAVRKERVEGSDIDILVIVDDNSEDFEKQELKAIKQKIQEIKQKGGEEGYELHIQPPKPISSWLSLLLEGRPWSITAIRHSQSIYDPDEFQSTLQSLVKSTPPRSKEDRSKALRDEAEQDIEEAEEMLENGFEKLIDQCYNTGKAYLSFHGEKPGSEQEMVEKFEKNTDIEIKFFKEMLEAFEKAEKGEKELKFQELEEYTEKSLEFVKNTKEALGEDIENLREEVVVQTYEEVKESCRVLLEDMNVDYQEEELFEVFQEEVIEAGVLDEEYWKFIEGIKQKKEGESEEKFLYEPLVGLRDFETAVNNIIENEFFETFELKEDSEAAQITPINEYEKEMLEKFEEVKGLYVITVENLLETENATVVLLADNTEEIDLDKIQEYADEEVEREIREEHGFNIHTKIRKLTDYWEKVQEGSKELMYEVKTGIISYDPQGLLNSTEKLIEQGEVPDTLPYISSELEESSVKIILPLPKIKREALQNYYTASIKLGQAVLLEEGISPPVQKKVPDTLREEVLETTEITQEDIDTIQEAITTYKQTEYGNIENLEAKKIDKIKEELENIEKRLKSRRKY